MSLQSLQAQKIVERLMNILGKNINVIDTRGNIIASGDITRLNLFHRAAKAAADQRKTVLVDDNNIIDYEGCKKGVNIPIFNDNKVIGVVGITGEPSEVEGYGMIVKELVELMIQEDERKKLELFHSRAIRSFAKELIKHAEGEDIDLLYSRAKLVNFDCSVSRVVIVADICDFSNLIDINEEKSEIMLQSLKQQITDIINSVSDLRYDVAFNLSEDRFIIFKEISGSMDEYCLTVQEQVLKKTGVRLYIGVGPKCDTLDDFNKSYTLANVTLNIGKKMSRKDMIYFSKDFRLQLLLKQIGDKQKKEYMESFGEIFKLPIEKQSKDLFLTIRAYYENSMNAQKTAQALFIHRNTLLYRLSKFKELYDIDITVPYNCMLIYIGTILMDLD
ncbi:carbohydrate diacid regulator [Geosporobacter subterraneus DSM 17957]|uniref:Carbohydrate diacid regulator n=1 Tax=Geosporobacter subterraneus DSM 17957 TaxID=1121919 RepID=A0A1M6I0T2_9FIRM|nr:sugar diacid recognition domain-containing protein [Geosporobacter subterraneus]SHJ27884.1 carbohydrate diacid regulator [Geosporobacter subterraneus DSM 17957]